MNNYTAKDDQSPLGWILARWNIDVPVIDFAMCAAARRDWVSLVFPFDGHLNETGHEYLARSDRAASGGPRGPGVDHSAVTAQRRFRVR